MGRTAESSPAGGRPPLTILVVAGDDVFLRLMHSFLERDDYRVFAAYDAAEAVALRRYERPGLVIIDAALPGVDAGELCRRMKAPMPSPEAGDTAVVPPAHVIVVASGTADEGLRERAYAAGAATVVTRPVDRAAFLKRIAEILEVEPRRFERLPACLPGTFEWTGRGDVAHPAAVRDLSEGGAYVISDEPVPSGTNVSLEIRLPGVDAVRVWGQVVRLDPDGSGFGVRFLDPPEPVCEAIRACVARFVAARELLQGAGAVVPGAEEADAVLAEPPAELKPFVDGAISPERWLAALRTRGEAASLGTRPGVVYPWEVDAAVGAQISPPGDLRRSVADAAAMRLTLEGLRRALVRTGVLDPPWDRLCAALARRYLRRVPGLLSSLRGESSSATLGRSGGFAGSSNAPGQLALTRTRLYRASLSLRQSVAALENTSPEDGGESPIVRVLRDSAVIDAVQRIATSFDPEGEPDPVLEAWSRALDPGARAAFEGWDGASTGADDGGILPAGALRALCALWLLGEERLHVAMQPATPGRRGEMVAAAQRILTLAEPLLRALTRRAADAADRGELDDAKLEALSRVRRRAGEVLFALREVYDAHRGQDDPEVFAPFAGAAAFDDACRALERTGRALLPKRGLAIEAAAMRLASLHDTLPPDSTAPPGSATAAPPAGTPSAPSAVQALAEISGAWAAVR